MAEHIHPASKFGFPPLFLPPLLLLTPVLLAVAPVLRVIVNTDTSSLTMVL
jgi:hypothetical protein